MISRSRRPTIQTTINASRFTHLNLVPYPNILFVMTDQQRADALGHIDDWVATPNLDRIAEEGVSFQNCVTTTPICIPARVTLATGLYCHNTHVWQNLNYTLPESANTWMRVLRDMGYRTSMFGKTHLHPHRGDLRDREHLLHSWGIDDVDEIGGPRASAAVMSNMTERWENLGLLQAYRDDYAERFRVKPHMVRPSVLPLEEYADVYVGQQAKRYLEQYEYDQPWCCWVTFGGPHEPWDAPEPYASQYDPSDMPDPLPRFSGSADRPKGWLDLYMERSTPKFDPGDEAVMRANYAGNVSLIDQQIGDILDVIESRRELDNTVIGFTSDHGEMNGDHRLIYKMNFLDGSVRVPLIFRSPKTANNGGGVFNDSVVENSDLGATLVELAGGELEYQQFSRSLVSGFDGSPIEGRDTGLSEFRGEFMLATDSWKIAVNRVGEPYLLFDKANDPNEAENLANHPNYSDIERSLLAELIQRISSSQLKAPWC